MRKWWMVVALIFGVPFLSWAIQSTVWLSSNSATNISTATLCNTTGSGGSIRGIFHGVCINTAGPGNVQVFNSSATALNTITGLFSTTTQVPCNFYDVAVSSNISVNHNGTGDITILYLCY
jgi:hypothetical protein